MTSEELTPCWTYITPLLNEKIVGSFALSYISNSNTLAVAPQLTDSLDLKKSPMQNKIQAEIKRFKKFQSMVTGKSDKMDVNDVDIQNYAKFLLKEGEGQEKRDLLGCLKGEIVLANKVISLK